MAQKFQFPKKIDKQLVAQAVLVILFMLTCWWIYNQPNPFESNETPPPPINGQVAPPNPTELAAKATAIQVEFDENRDQTLGIVLGGTVLVVLVLGSTLLVVGRR